MGGAEIQHFTASGAVDMTDIDAIMLVLKDPTYDVSTSWGNIKLDGDWSSRLPNLLCIVFFVLTVVLLNIFWHYVESPDIYGPDDQIRFTVSPVVKLPW